MLDAAGVSEEGLLASMVQRLEAREDRAAGARCAGNTPRHLRAGGREVEAQDKSRADTTHTPGDLTVDSMDYAALKTFEYIHIPKTGGVSTSIFGNRFGVKWGTFVYSEKLEVEHTSSFTHSSGQTSSCSTWHIPPKWMPTAGSMKRFAFIRDPIQRAVSLKQDIVACPVTQSKSMRTYEKSLQVAATPGEIAIGFHSMISSPFGMEVLMYRRSHFALKIWL